MKRITNKSEFDELIEKISECLDWYEKKSFEDKSYNLRLDNGDDLRIVFDRNTIAHLLGIDTEYLKTTGLFKGKSYDILKFICNDPYRVYNMIRGNHLLYSNFISDFAFDKVDGFKNICGIDLGNIEFVCKYSKARSYVTGLQQLEGDYYVAYKSNNGLFIIGFKKNGDYYYPMTNRVIDFNNEESMNFLKVLLSNQIITMATLNYLYFFNSGSRTDNIYVDYNKKAKLINKLTEYVDDYDAIIDVSVGYSYIIDKMIQSFETSKFNINIYQVLAKIFLYINNRTRINIGIIEREFGKLPEELVLLINDYNNSLNNKLVSNMGEYTKSIMKEVEGLRTEKCKYIQELESLRQELLKCKELNSQLQAENNGYKEKMDVIRKVLS